MWCRQRTAPYSQLKDILEIKSNLITYGSYDVVDEFIADELQINEIIHLKSKN